MPRARMIVTYDDGQVVDFNPNRPRYLLDMENRFGVQQPEKHEHMVWLAHHVVAPDEPLDEWIDRVADIDAEDLSAEASEGKDSSSTE
jgi:hypothetical protein